MSKFNALDSQLDLLGGGESELLMAIMVLDQARDMLDDFNSLPEEYQDILDEFISCNISYDDTQDRLRELADNNRGNDDE